MLNLVSKILLGVHFSGFQFRFNVLPVFLFWSIGADIQGVFVKVDVLLLEILDKEFVHYIQKKLYSWH